MEKKIINESAEIEKIVLKNKDGSEETLENGMVICLNKLDDGTSNMNMRFCKLSMEEIDSILYGLRLLMEGKFN